MPESRDHAGGIQAKFARGQTAMTSGRCWYIALPLPRRLQPEHDGGDLQHRGDWAITGSHAAGRRSSNDMGRYQVARRKGNGPSAHASM